MRKTDGLADETNYHEGNRSGNRDGRLLPHRISVRIITLIACICCNISFLWCCPASRVIRCTQFVENATVSELPTTNLIEKALQPFHYCLSTKQGEYTFIPLERGLHIICRQQFGPQQTRKRAGEAVWTGTLISCLATANQTYLL